MPELTATQRRAMNEQYRDGHEPSELHQRAFRQVLRGEGISEEDRKAMIDRLYEPFKDRHKDLPVDPWEASLPTKEQGNGLATAVVRNEYSINLHISEELYRQQPIGVLLRPINDDVRKKGEALITDTCPRTAEVEDHVMPAEHFKLTIEPLPLWFEKFAGQSGYTL